jgi:hypothetical protein
MNEVKVKSVRKNNEVLVTIGELRFHKTTWDAVEVLRPYFVSPNSHEVPQLANENGVAEPTMRTAVQADAKVYANWHEAAKDAIRLKKSYPNREFYLEEL